MVMVMVMVEMTGMIFAYGNFTSRYVLLFLSSEVDKSNGRSYLCGER